MAVGSLILRLVLGGLFFGHGAQKLFGWFGGEGLGGWARKVEGLGYTSPLAMARLAGVCELAGGGLLALGLAVPLGAAMIMAVMINAIVSVHARHGWWNRDGGVELPATNAACALALGFIGGGSFSLDRVLDMPLAGIYAGAWTFVVGIGAATLALMLRQRRVVTTSDAGERRAA